MLCGLVLALGHLFIAGIDRNNSKADLFGTETSTTPRPPPSAANTSGEGRPKKKNKKSTQDTMDQIAESISRFGAALERIIMKEEDSHVKPLYDALMAIPGITDRDPKFVEAYQYLAREKVLASTFLGLSDEGNAHYIYREFGLGFANF